MPIMLVELYFMLYNTQATARSTDWASVLSLGVPDILVVPTNVVKFPNPSPISNINSITLRSAILKLFKRRQTDRRKCTEMHGD